MPRDGSGVASKPPGSTATPNTTIQSTPYNATVDDLYALQNEARPITAGGTGATTAVTAGDNLSTKGADIPSAATTDIGAATGRYVQITGTNTITSFGTKAAGVIRHLTFTAALTLTHNATSLILPGAAAITTAAGDTAIFVSEGSGNWRCLAYQRSTGTPLVATPIVPPKGYIFGLPLATNATDAANDIDIATGEASSDAATPTLLTLSTALTKRIDASWAVGNNQGGLDTGTAANTTYYVWLIQRSDTGVVDVLFSASATSPTLPTSYDRKRAIGQFTRAAGVNGPVQTRTTAEQQLSWRDTRQGMVKLLSGTVTSGAATLDIPLMNATGRCVLVRLVSILPSSSGADLRVVISKDAMATWDTAADSYRYGRQQVYSFTNSPTQGASDSATFMLIDNNLNSTSSRPASFDINIYDLKEDTTWARVTWLGASPVSDGNTRVTTGHGFRKAASRIDALRFSFSTGNIAVGIYEVYGYV